MLAHWWQPIAQPTQVQAQLFQLPLLEPAPVPIFLASPSASLHFTAASLYVMDVPSGSVLFEWNSQQIRSSASTTKLMTALVAQTTYQPDQVLTVRQESLTPGTVLGLAWGEQLTYRELLAGLLVHSGNDAAAVLANNYPGGETEFVAAMNQRAQELHLGHTHFANPTGLDALNHYTSARDLAILAKEVMKDPVLRDLVSTRVTTVTDVTGKLTHELLNTNELLKTDARVVGIKTGTTEAAGQVLVTQVESGERSLIVVVMGSEDRYQDTRQLIEWSLAHYDWRIAP